MPLTLYAVSRTTGRSGEWIYTPYRTLQHVRHSVFNAAHFYNFLEIYEYKIGQFEPYSEIVERGIAKYLIYNPYYDYYEASEEGYQKLPDLYNEIKTVLREEELNRLKGIRINTEKYTAKELNVILHSFEKDYIKIKPPNIPFEYHYEIAGTIENMVFHYNWQSRPDIITKQSAENLLKYFQLKPEEYLRNQYK